MPGPGISRGSTNRYRLAPQTKLAKIRNDEAARCRVANRTGKVNAKTNVTTDGGTGDFLSGFKRAMEAALPLAKRRKLYLLNDTTISPRHPKCPTQTAPGVIVAEEFDKFVKWLLPSYNNRQWRIDNGLVIAPLLRPIFHAKTHAPGTILVFNLMTTNNVHGSLGSKTNGKQIILGATLYRRRQQQPHIHHPADHHHHHHATHNEPTKTTATTVQTTTSTLTPSSGQGHSPTGGTYQLYARAYLNFDMSSAAVVGRWTDATTEPDIFCHIVDRLCHQQTTTDEVHILRNEESFRQADQDGRLNHRCEKALCLFATDPAWMTGKH